MTTTRIKLTGPADNTPAARSIDMTPTWAGIMPALVAALQHGTAEGQGMARAELARLAQEVDSANAAARDAREAAKASPVPAGQASHLKTATAALAGVFQGYARQNTESATYAAHAGRRAAFTARAHAFAHAAADAAARGGNDSAELKAAAAELADRMAEELAAADREHNARAEEVAELNRAVAAADARAESNAAELVNSRAARATARRQIDALREEAATAREGEEAARVGLQFAREERDAIRAELARVQELAARAFVRLSAVVADAGTDGAAPRLVHGADREELARAIVTAGDLLQRALDAAPAEGAAIREHARDAAAMLETYANGRQNNESRGQAMATVRAIRAALS